MVYNPNNRAKSNARYALVLDCPWKRALLTYLPEQSTLTSVYQSLGWSPGVTNRRTSHPDLRATEIVALAKALKVEPVEFFRTLAKEMAKAGLKHQPPQMQRSRRNLPRDPASRKSSSR